MLDDIYKRKILSDDLSLYLHRPSATDISMATEGMISFYVLAPVPNNESNINWEIESPKIVAQIQNTLEERLLRIKEKYCELILCNFPDTFEHRFKTYKGSGFSISPIFSQSAWFRLITNLKLKIYFLLVQELLPRCRLIRCCKFSKVIRKNSSKIK